MKDIIKKNPGAEKIFTQVAETAGYLWEKGWAERNAGNISVNIDEYLNHRPDNLDKYELFDLEKEYNEISGKFFLVTGTGRRMRDIAKDPYDHMVIVKVSSNGKGYQLIRTSNNNHLLPTSELPTHLGIHQMIAIRNSGEKVVLHTHANEVVAFTQNEKMKNEKMINEVIWGMHPEAIVFIPKGVGFVPYTLPGTQEIADHTIGKLEDFDIVLWEKHGIFAIGDCVLETFDNIDIVAKSMRIWLMCRNAGFDPEGLNEDQLNELKKMVEKFNA